jgi:DUF1680 family protein
LNREPESQYNLTAEFFSDWESFPKGMSVGGHFGFRGLGVCATVARDQDAVMNQPIALQTRSSLAVIISIVLAGSTLCLTSAEVILLPDKITPSVPDRQDFQIPDRVHLTGWVGTRIEANEANRLVKLDPARLLEGYRKRPGRQAWDGEHVGKWLHAATLAWVNTGDPALREKLDYVVAELIRCQLPDGYLGTYLEKDRWTEWDVWAHKYNLIGLITYMRYTGNDTPLLTCRRMADLLCSTFGDEPGKRDILKAGWHVGMAPTSVLEPMVLLYRLTGEARYLDFCKYVLRAWEQPNGPKIISTLRTLKRVDKVGNGKAYEMLSCLNGALEYYRTVNDPIILEACLNAWQDIVANRLYLTGTASYGELFHDDYDLPNVNNVGETCVTVTWLQFNAQLLRLTGEARFAGELEKVVLNQLFGAQRCDGSAWGYYVQMEGKKPYSSTLDGHCCLSSGPRGVALIPTFAVSTDADGLVLNLYDSGTANLKLRDGTVVKLRTETLYPSDDKIHLTLDPAEEKSFALKIRVPSWCSDASVEINGQKTKAVAEPDGYSAIRRSWNKGDRIDLSFKLEPRVIVGNHLNEGKVAILYGPLVLAADEALLGPEDKKDQTTGLTLGAIAAAGTDLDKLDVTPEPAPAPLKTWPSAKVYRINAVARRTTKICKRGAPLKVELIPFADAGETGSQYKLWLPLPHEATTSNVLLDGEESRSRPGNVSGSIADDDFQSFVVTFDGRSADEDWFEVKLGERTSVKRIVFAHGKTFHDGGWFDSGTGKPRLEAQLTLGGSWELVGEFKQYPSTSATDPAGLKGGERFTCTLEPPRKILALRVIGKPACGDNPQQRFSSCSELQAFAE